LLEHTTWCEAESSRSKNALNKIKLRLQLVANKDYNILVKNEAHIRMSSSSWYAAKMNWKIGWVSIVLLILIVLFKDKPIVESLNCPHILSVIRNNFVVFLFPASVIMLNRHIYKASIKFLHYQRLREIFFALQVYDEYFGEGCVNRNKRKNHESFKNASN
jgi:hypothetical protein